MRSNLVFRAQEKVTNRFELCLLVSRSARAMTGNSAQMHDVINNAFSLIGKHCGLFRSLAHGAVPSVDVLDERLQDVATAPELQLDDTQSEDSAQIAVD